MDVRAEHDRLSGRGAPGAQRRPPVNMNVDYAKRCAGAVLAGAGSWRRCFASAVIAQRFA
jgi:hypothetical protein